MTVAVLEALLHGGVVTLEVATGAWIVGSLLGLVLAIARHLGGRIAAVLVTVIVSIVRGIPQLVILYLIFFGLPSIGINFSSVTAAIVALGISEASFTAEYYRASIATVTAEQEEAGRSLGLSEIKIFGLIVIPQALVVAVPALLNSLLGLLKAATLAAAVGAPEILYESELAMNQTGHLLAIAATVVGVYIVVSLPAIQLVRRLERWVSRYLISAT
jgi:His/Glu/Gln/Arg/opine family amino acid ABC transporter permease subunit